MRIRSIRPEFWSSEDVAAMDWFTRLVFVGLWSYVDDNGVGRGVEQLIVAALFPLDGDLPEASRRVTGALYHLSEHGQITRYEVDGKRYLHITAWEKHQRIEKRSTGRYPLPTSENANLRKDSPTTPVALREPSTPGEGEKGRRGEGLLSDSSDATDEPDLFGEFYDAYPRHEARRKAEQAYRAAIKRADHDTIMAGLARFPFSDDRKFVPLPASWLNGDRWADEPSNVLPIRGGRPSGAALTDEQIADVLGPDYEPIAPPAELDPERDWRAYQDWMRQARTARRAQREEQALHRLGGAG